MFMVSEGLVYNGGKGVTEQTFISKQREVIQEEARANSSTQ